MLQFISDYTKEDELYMRILLILAGYLSGSVLYAKIFGYMFRHKDITADTKDENPGTANAFMQGGAMCGMCTLFFELIKGFAPVYIYQRMFMPLENGDMGLICILIAPVLGHIFSVFSGFKGGKGIAVTFGCLLGCAPDIYAALVLAFFFILFSLIIHIYPHYYRTLATYFFTTITLWFSKEAVIIKLGFTCMAVLVMGKLCISSEKKEKMKVNLLWMH